MTVDEKRPEVLPAIAKDDRSKCRYMYIISYAYIYIIWLYGVAYEKVSQEKTALH